MIDQWLFKLVFLEKGSNTWFLETYYTTHFSLSIENLKGFFVFTYYCFEGAQIYSNYNITILLHFSIFLYFYI